MSFPVVVQVSDGQFSAALVGVPELRVVRPTRDAAITALRAELEQRVEQGELISVDIAEIGLASLAGKYANDPTLHEIGRDAYQQRDADPAP